MKTVEEIIKGGRGATVSDEEWRIVLQTALEHCDSAEINPRRIEWQYGPDCWCAVDGGYSSRSGELRDDTLCWLLDFIYDQAGDPAEELAAEIDRVADENMNNAAESRREINMGHDTWKDDDRNNILQTSGELRLLADKADEIGLAAGRLSGSFATIAGMPVEVARDKLGPQIDELARIFVLLEELGRAGGFSQATKEVLASRIRK